MIDFRYHLVSLVSVFLALAIGLAIGAGTLRGAASEALQSQISALRSDKANLGDAVKNRNETIASQNSAIAALGEDAVTDQLAGRTVTVIVLPGADITKEPNLTSLLTTAGATTVSTVAVSATWSKPAASADRDAVLTALSAQLASLGLPADATQTTKLAALLARSVVATESSDRDTLGSQVRQALSGAGLVTVTEDNARRADLAIILTPKASDGAAGDDEAWQKAELSAGVALAGALDTGSDGAVVLGAAGADDSDGLVAALRRANSTASTVDTGQSVLGSVGSVLALAQQASGGSGKYGTGSDATAVIPPVAASTGTTP